MSSYSLGNEEKEVISTEILVSAGLEYVLSFFVTHAAKGIQRPIFTIYTKVIHLFNVRNYVGRWSSSQEKELMR